VTENSMFAASTTGDTIAVVLEGTLVPLPDSQVLDGFTANGDDTVFTVPAAAAGNYYISYKVNVTAGLLLSSGILINGTLDPASVRAPLLAATNFDADFIVTLAAGDTISLELSGLVELVILQDGVGASLNIIRLS